MSRDELIILSAHQPVYLPWLGLFHKIALSDIYCVFDIVQYQRRDFNNRNKIKTSTGPIWLTVPVQSSGRLDSNMANISNIEIISNGWQKKHLKSIELNYKKAPYFDEYFCGLERILGNPYQYLVDLNFDLLLFLLGVLNINTKIIKASDYSFRGTKSDLVLDMCTQLDANIYIFGKQGKDYADINAFKSKGVHPYFQSYNHPKYNQIKGEFEPFMSVLDLIFNHGKASKEIMMSNNVNRLELISNLLE